MRQSFTLIEVVVSAVLIAIIGVSLIKLSTSNIEGVEYSREKRYDLFSLVLYQVSEFGYIKDYSGIEDVDMPNWKVDATQEDVLTQEYELPSAKKEESELEPEETNESKKIVSLTIYKEHIEMDEDGVDFFRLK